MPDGNQGAVLSSGKYTVRVYDPDVLSRLESLRAKTGMKMNEVLNKALSEGIGGAEASLLGDKAEGPGKAPEQGEAERLVKELAKAEGAGRELALKNQSDILRLLAAVYDGVVALSEGIPLTEKDFDTGLFDGAPGWLYRKAGDR
jgi:hypothetical protein